MMKMRRRRRARRGRKPFGKRTRKHTAAAPGGGAGAGGHLTGHVVLEREHRRPELAAGKGRRDEEEGGRLEHADGLAHAHAGEGAEAAGLGLVG